jgi:hypothetical protein
LISNEVVMPESSAQKKAGYGLIAICILGLVGFVGWNFLSQNTEEKVVVQQPLVIPSPEPQESQPLAETPRPEIEEFSEAPEPIEPQQTLPNLNQSDSVLSAAIEDINPDLLPLLANDELIRKFVRAVNGLSEDKLVQTFRPIKSPAGRFSVTELGLDARLNLRLYRLNPDNFLRYKIYRQALESIPPDQAVALYRRYYPLMQSAYEELGLREPSFHVVALRAIDNLQAGRDRQQSDATAATLKQPAVMYEFVDEELENLSACEKLKLRIGPDNALALEQWLSIAETQMRAYKP